MLSLRTHEIDLLTMVAPSGGVTADVPVVIGNLCVIPVTDAAEGEKFAGCAIGVFELPKATGGGQSFAAGAIVEWDSATGKCIANAGGAGDFDIGFAVEAASTTDTTVKVVKPSVTTTVNA